MQFEYYTDTPTFYKYANSILSPVTAPISSKYSCGVIIKDLHTKATVFNDTFTALFIDDNAHVL